MFKVGDKVRVKEGFLSHFKFYAAGAEGTVVNARKDCDVRFTSGDYDPACNATWSVDTVDLELVVPYSSTFTTPPSPVQPSGHDAVHTGLQKHSVGEDYPLGVVGYGLDTRYVVENILHNNVLCWPDGRVMQFNTAYEAYALLSLYRNSRLTGLIWVSGRPKSVNNILVMPD